MSPFEIFLENPLDAEGTSELKSLRAYNQSMVLRITASLLLSSTFLCIFLCGYSDVPAQQTGQGSVITDPTIRVSVDSVLVPSSCVTGKAVRLETSPKKISRFLIAASCRESRGSRCSHGQARGPSQAQSLRLLG